MSVEEALQELLELASRVCAAPMAAVSLVDADQQWFRAQRGFDADGGPLSRSLCALPVTDVGAVAVADTLADPRTLHCDLVVGEPRVRSYVGAPLLDDHGSAIGTLCVLDTVPRALQPWQVAMLEVLARQVMTHLHPAPVLEERDDVENELHDARRTLSYLETHDALTGLLNRTALTDLIDGLADANAAGTVSSAFLHIDIDEFAQINDVYGHAAGDRVLVTIGDRLHLGARGDDAVARLGGDAFAVLVPNASSMGPETLARRLLQAVAMPIEFGELHLHVTASIGIARWRVDLPSADGVLRAAAGALHDAKLLGGNNIATAEGHRDGMRRRADAQRFVRHIIDEKAMCIHFQPVWSVSSGRLVGHEALLRWRDVERFNISPADFVGVAEEIGMIGHITEFTVREACRLAARRRSSGADAMVSVNMSAMQIERDEVMLVTARALNDYGLDPDVLVFEVTESAKLAQSPAGIETLREMHNMGLRLALDDVGTGAATLGLLRSVPFDVLKIDGSFAPEGGDVDREVLRSMVTLGHSLGMDVVAEAVEEPMVLDQLREVGCDFAQGFLLGHPTPGELVFDPISASPTHPLIAALHPQH